ncbi:MAG: ATP phosphoribosyltransferase [Candidatus Schekmanbacteria bacterium]|nr:ATP phosphoribosyltransferase [Candidatus Schekmanbacteria bacterium]
MSFVGQTLKLVLPKGRIADKVYALLGEVGYRLEALDRSYRPKCSVPGVEVKLLKPQIIPTLLALGRHDIGFAGHDWVVEQGAELVELMDTGFDPVRIVAAVPEAMGGSWRELGRPLVIATEYERLARRFVEENGLDAVVVQTHGATEVFPPEDADMIIDNTATGQTLAQNGLVEVAAILESSTRLLARRDIRQAPPPLWERIEDMVALVQGVLRARHKVLLEMNVRREHLEQVVRALPAMRSPTVASLHSSDGFAIKVAVDRADVRTLVPVIRALGATDILQFSVDMIVP